MNKKIIIFLAIILIFVLLFLILLTNFFLGKKKLLFEEKITPTPVPIIGYQIPTQSKKNLAPNILVHPTITLAQPLRPVPSITDKLLKTDIKTILSKISILTPEEFKKFEDLKKLIPYETADFRLIYSPFLNKFILAKKTGLAEEKFRQWVAENGLTNVFTTNPVLVADKSADDYQKEIEEKYQNILEQNKVTLHTLENQIASSEAALSPNKEINLLLDFTKVLLSFNLATDTSSLRYDQTTDQPPPVSSSLTGIFNEVGSKVGVPAKILEAVMRIEYPSTFNLSSSEIASYSQPGNMIPDCGPNLCSAAGPMQMTIGIDDQGDYSCPRCGAGFCPNAWSSYGSSINSYGTYTHDPLPCNLKDNVYASAAKLRNDSGANDPSDWTQDQVYRAAESYYGSCSENYRYERLGNRTYCEFLWWYYTRNNNEQANNITQNTDLESVLNWAEIINNNLEKGSVDPSYYNKLVDTPQNVGYTATYREGLDTGIGRTGQYWCTNLVIDSYNLAGIKGLGIEHQTVVNMRSFWMNALNYKYIDYLNGDKAQALSQIQSGCAVFFERNPGVHTGFEHAAIIKSINIDSNTNGYMETYDSNSTVKITNYPIYSGDIKNTPLSELLVGFGCI